MSIYVYITPECRNQAQRRGLLELLLNHKERIERNQNLSGFEDINNSRFYKRRLSNNSRVIGYLFRPPEHEYEIFILDHFFQRDNDDYMRLIDDIGRNCYDRWEPRNKEEVIGEVEERIKVKPIIKDQPTDEERKWLVVPDIMKDLVNINIKLSEEQINLIEGIQNGTVRMPLFINGNAGSGKTTMLIKMFVKYLKHYLKNLNGLQPIYLTYNESLVKKARKDAIDELLILEPDLYDTIDKDELLKERFDSCFKTFNELLIENLTLEQLKKFPPCNRLNISQKENGSDEDYERRLLEELNKMRIEFADFKNIIWRRYKDHTELDVSTVWYVIRVFIKGKRTDAGYYDFYNYKESTRNDKSVTDEQFQEVYDEIWKSYRQLCRNRGYWDNQDLVYYILDLANQGEVEISKQPCVFCDEAQDFTTIELEYIFRSMIWAKRQMPGAEVRFIPLMFAGDPCQTINPTGFNWTNIKSMFYSDLQQIIHPNDRTPLDLSIEEMTINYRSSGKIIKFCNLIQIIRMYCTNDRKVSPQNSYVNDNAGNVYCLPIDDNDENQRKTIDKILREPSFQKILNCEDNEVYNLFRQDILKYVYSEDYIREKESKKEPIKRYWSALSIKGLEYDNIVLYKFASNDEARQVFEVLEQQNNQVNHLDIPLKHWLNKLYVSVSRAKKNLIIIDTEEAFEKFWKYSLESARQKGVIEKCILEPSIRDNWAEKIVVCEPFDINFKFDKVDVNLRKDEAIRLKERGIEGREADYLVRAADIFDEIDSYEEEFECRAIANEFREMYKEAGNYYAKIPSYDKSLECYWRAKEWRLYVDTHKNIDQGSDEQHCKFVTARYLMKSSEKDSIDIHKYIDVINVGNENPVEYILKNIADNECIKLISKKILEDLIKEGTKDVSADKFMSIIEGFTVEDYYSDDKSKNSRAKYLFNCERYPDAIELWDACGDTKHVRYYKSKVCTEKDPDRIYWLSKAKLVNDVVDEVEKDEIKKLIKVKPEKDQKKILNEVINSLITDQENREETIIKILTDYEYIPTVEYVLDRCKEENNALDEMNKIKAFEIYIKMLIDQEKYPVVRNILNDFYNSTESWYNKLFNNNNNYDKNKFENYIYERLMNSDCKKSVIQEIAYLYFSNIISKSIENNKKLNDYPERMAWVVKTIENDYSHTNFNRKLLNYQKEKYDPIEVIVDSLERYFKIHSKEYRKSSSSSSDIFYLRADSIAKKWGEKDEDSIVYKNFIIEKVKEDKNRLRIRDVSNNKYLTIYRKEMEAVGEVDATLELDTVDSNANQLESENIEARKGKNDKKKKTEKKPDAKIHIEEWKMVVKLYKEEGNNSVTIQVEGEDSITLTY